jgi:acetyl-CoA carboxylase biotin carboxylase subunit
MKVFRKILIANRGEIAARIIRTAKRMGITTVLVHSIYDKDSLAASLADELVYLPGDSLSDTYLNQKKIIEAAISSGCEAIHPGYGFLSENAEFAEKVAKNKLIFIGPDVASIRMMGNKLEAKAFAKNAGVPILDGYSGTAAEILENTKNPEFPILVKAAAGGGGKGMKIVNNLKELPQALESAEREALNYFSNGELYIEKYITKPRHIEVQILGDHFGNIVHLYERECTIQRRYQKIIEECPSPTLNDHLREQITSSALDLAKKAGYKNAGTIEFLLDENGKFYFLEMNTRIQVEHPATEMATGVDLVEEQIYIASGNPLRISQQDISINGHAIECRIYAEDPWNNFIPAPGEMTLYHPPSADKIRIDSAYSRASIVYSFYDPMISKVIAHKPNRNEAIQQMIEALMDYSIHGIKTNIGYLITLLKQPEFVQNNVSTKYIEENAQLLFDTQVTQVNSEIRFVPVIGYVLKSLSRNEPPRNIWEQIGFWRMNNELEIWLDCQTYVIQILHLSYKHFHLNVDNKFFTGEYKVSEEKVELTMAGINHKVFVTEKPAGMPDVSFQGDFYPMFRKDILRRSEFYKDIAPDEHPASANVKSPMPGKIIQVNVKPGDKVKKGELLMIIEAMKMENNILSPMDGTIWEVIVEEGNMVDSSSPLVYFEELKK